MAVTAPSTFTGPAFTPTFLILPTGGTPADAGQYITIAPDPVFAAEGLQFTSTVKTLHFIVTGNFPIVMGLAKYAYTVTVQEFSGNPNFVNGGHFISATTVPPAGFPPQPPTVSISQPALSYTFPLETVPLSLPLNVKGIADANLTIIAMDAIVNDIPVPLTYGAPSQTLNGDATFLLFPLGIPAVGDQTYHVKVTATDSIQQVATTTQDVVVHITGAAVTIQNPSEGQVITVPHSSLDAQGRTAVPLTFIAAASAPLVTTEWQLDDDPVVTQIALGLSKTVTGSMLVKVGPHSITARTTDVVGDTAQDINDFTVAVTGAPPPQVTIGAPINGSTKLFALSATPYIIPFNFTAKSVATGGLIRTVIATLDGSTTPLPISTSALNSQIVTGSADLSFLEAGSHTVSVIAVDDYGNAVANSTFTITVADQTPTIAITPIADIALTYPATTTNVPFTFKTSTASGFTIDSVSAVLDGTTALTFTNTPALGTSNVVTSGGTILALGAGSHTISVTGGSGGKTVTTTTTFKVTLWTLAPPTVVITAPTAASFEMTGTSLSIPLNFTGTSNYTGGTITALTATLKNNATGAISTLNVLSSTLGQKVAYGAATMTVTAAGTYTITVAAKDPVAGAATTTQNFAVTVNAPKKVSGNVFFDVDFDGTLDSGEFGLSGVTVTLYNSANGVVATTMADCSGDYSFANVAPGTYKVTATAPTGLVATPSGSTGSRSVTVGTVNVTALPIGFGLNFTALRAMSANGYTIGFWKNNVDKAIAGKSSGTQIPNATIVTYTKTLGSLALSPYDNISMKTASSTMGSTSSASKDLLSKQLVASEYNYANGAYLNGNKTLTFLFIWWGEYVLQNSTSYSSTQLIWTKDWFDAYNNSHGGVVAGPQ